ncbi:MAG: RelA/SpoT family protein [Candidatus Paceibacterota bacterium]|jgi:GTP pyrophosphokinase
MASVDEIISLIKKPSAKDRDLIRRVYSFAEKAHLGQKRNSGEPYFDAHVVPVAKTLATIGMDARTIAAGLLHDTLEDAHLPEGAIRNEFGEEIFFLVQGVTKLGKLKYRGLDRHVESLRKFFIAIAQDVNVVIIKLADRLHNVSTLEYVPEAKRKRIAKETLEIYAPIADRLGMWKLKADLEDYSFKYVYPKEYEEIYAILKDRKHASEEYLRKFHKSFAKALAENGIKRFTIDHRIKHLYSLYQKWLRYNKDIEKIYDVVALRIVVPTIEDCYHVLGIVHKNWRPLPGRIKDYIALPKPNGYQSIHTTIFTGDGAIVEIQIRTKEMHEKAEYGIASHLIYKESDTKEKRQDLEKNLSWIEQLIEWQKNVSKTGEYLEHLKMDFFKNQVFVFTPMGDVIDLPEDSSPIDFAYAIHSDVGDHVSGARVNKKMVSLDTKLKNGDIVEIVTKDSAKPSSKWLDYAKTHMAKKHIRIHLQGVGPIKRFFS